MSTLRQVVSPGQPSGVRITRNRLPSEGLSAPVPSKSTEYRLILEAASQLLAVSPLAEVTLKHVAQVSGLHVDDIVLVFPNMREVGIAILGAEGDSMRLAQKRATEQTTNPIEVLHLTFHYVGENIATSPIVRAGMRIAAESRRYFPERQIDPFRTWRNFIHGELSRAEQMGLLKPQIDIDAITWLLVTAGLGSKELVSFRNAWDEIEYHLGRVLGAVLELILVDRPPA